MANWTFNSNDYTAREFALIPEGDHRVRIIKVVEKSLLSYSDIRILYMSLVFLSWFLTVWFCLLHACVFVTC